MALSSASAAASVMAGGRSMPTLRAMLLGCAAALGAPTLAETTDEQVQQKADIPVFFSKAALDRYKPIACKVIDQSTRNSQNYLTIEKAHRMA